MKLARLVLGGLCLLAASTAGSASAQTLTKDQPTLTFSPTITFTTGPKAEEPLYAFAPATFTVKVTGPNDLRVTLKSMRAITIRRTGDNVTLTDLFSLQEPLNVTLATTKGEATTTSSTAEPIGTSTGGKLSSDFTVATDQTLTTPTTVEKRVVFKGVSKTAVVDAHVYFGALQMELEATAGGKSVTKRTTYLLTSDNVAPGISTESAAMTHDDEFPVDFEGIAPAVREDMEPVKLQSKVTLGCPGMTALAMPSGTSREADSLLAHAYRVIVTYDDGTRWAYDADATFNGSVTRIETMAPNIGRGDFAIEVRSPYGQARSSQHHTFPSNVFTTDLTAIGSILAINTGTPMSDITERSFFGASRQPARLPSTRSSVVGYYAEWESATVGKVSAQPPLAVFSAKLDRTPSKGSVAHSGNMPRLTCSGGGIATITAHVTAKLKAYASEDADCRVED